jgi:hypothetical protein
MTMKQPEAALTDRPQFHRLSDGKPTSWALPEPVLRYMRQHLGPGMRTLETGAGYSTVIFAVSGADHICVTPAENEKTEILSYLQNFDVPVRVKFAVGFSETVLPAICPELRELDFVFIDGAHRFPMPVLDFHYAASRLKIGGLLGVDDVHIPSVKVLYDFLAGEEDDWQLVHEVEHTAFFKRLLNTKVASDWQGQKMNRSLLDGRKRRPRRTGRALLSRLLRRS